MNGGRVVILTALNVEYEAVHKTIVDPQVHWHRADTRFEIGRLGRNGCEVALGLVGKGNHPAAVLAERAITEFSPAALLFVGIAGALWSNIKPGDVVVASQVYAYHGGTSNDDRLRARPRSWEIPHRAAQLVQHLIRTDEWSQGLNAGHRPTAHFGPIAAGEIVQDSKFSGHAQWIRDHYNDALAVEMEGAGVAQAAHLNRSLPVVVVRGISDRADGSKTHTDGQNWQPRAAAHAVAFAAALAPSLADRTTEAKKTTSGGEKAMGTTFSNIAGGNARVGVQAGYVRGNVAIGDHTPPADLLTAIAELRGLIQAARRDGQLDTATYTAASTELSTAEAGSADKGKVLLALKRFRGLVSDVSEIAAVAGSIISGLQGLS